MGGTLVGEGFELRPVNTYLSQVLQEKLKDGNLEPTELAIAAAAQVHPWCLPHLASIAYSPWFPLWPRLWSCGLMGICHPPPSGCRERTSLTVSPSVGQMLCGLPCAPMGPWVSRARRYWGAKRGWQD